MKYWSLLYYLNESRLIKLRYSMFSGSEDPVSKTVMKGNPYCNHEVDFNSPLTGGAELDCEGSITVPKPLSMQDGERYVHILFLFPLGAHVSTTVIFRTPMLLLKPRSAFRLSPTIRSVATGNQSSRPIGARILYMSSCSGPLD